MFHHLVYVQRSPFFRPPTQVKAHSKPQIERVYSCHRKRSWKKTGWCILSTQRIHNPSCHVPSFISVKSELVPPNPTSKAFKSAYAVLWRVKYSSCDKSYRVDETSPAFHYYTAITMAGVWMPYFPESNQLGLPTIPCSRRNKAISILFGFL